jgi:hypothetical protein
MNKIIATSVLFLTVISCGVLVRPRIVFEIENKTSQDLNLQIFGKSKLLHNINIKSQSSFDTTVTYASPGSNNQNSPFDNEKVDSIVVIFKTNKMITYYCDRKLLVGVPYKDSCVVDGKGPVFFNDKSSKPFKQIKTKNFVYEESDYEKAKPF